MRERSELLQCRARMRLAPGIESPPRFERCQHACGESRVLRINVFGELSDEAIALAGGRVERTRIAHRECSGERTHPVRIARVEVGVCAQAFRACLGVAAWSA